MNKTPVKDFNGRILGWIVTEPDGRQKAMDFKGKLLGTYYPDRNTTNDFYGRVLYRGNMITSLIPTDIKKIK